MQSKERKKRRKAKREQPGSVPDGKRRYFSTFILKLVIKLAVKILRYFLGRSKRRRTK